MPIIDTLHFTDRDSGDPAVIMVRVERSTIDLTLSLESDGDLSVFFAAAELERLILALQHAQQQLQPPS